MDNSRYMILGYIIKLVLISALLIYTWIYWFSDSTVLTLHKLFDQEGTLIFVGFLLAGSIGGTFAFTYKTEKKGNWIIIVGHVTTALLIGGIGILFEISCKVLGLDIWNLTDPLVCAMCLVFASIIAFDYWDFLRQVEQ